MGQMGNVNRLQANIKIYVDVLGGEEVAKEAVKLTKPYQNVPVDQFPYYKQLCRGESVEVTYMYSLCIL